MFSPGALLPTRRAVVADDGGAPLPQGVTWG